MERYNRTFMNAVRCFVDDQPYSWGKYLRGLAGARRSAVHRNTGYTPNKFTLRREENIPTTLMYKPPEFFSK